MMARPEPRPGRAASVPPARACACRNSVASRSTASSRRGASPGAGLVAIHCSISRATTLISGKPYDPPEPARRWKRVLRRRAASGRSARNAAMSLRSSSSRSGNSARYSRCSSRIASSSASVMARAGSCSRASRAPATKAGAVLQWPAHVGALPRREDRAPVVHHADDRHARPAVRVPVTTSTTANPRSTGAGGAEHQREARPSRVAGAPERAAERRRRARAAPPSRRAGHVVRDQLQDALAPTRSRPASASPDADRLELAAQPLERLAMVGRDPGDQRRRRLRAVALGPPAVHPGGALRDQPLQRAIGVRPRQPGGPGDGVAGAGSTGEQDLVDQAFGGSEAEMGEIDAGHD